MHVIKQSQTTQALMFLMVDATDMTTPETGLSPTVTLSKNGAAFASPAGAVTEVGSGWYKVAGNATDSGTLGPLVLHATGTGAAATDAVFMVVAYDPLSATDLGLTTVASRASQTSVDTIDDFLDTEIAALTTAVGTIDDLLDTEMPALTAAVAALPTTLLDLSNGVETGLTLRQAMRLLAAASAGKLSGAATTTIVIRNAIADSKDRITATVDADGNRSAITTDLT